MLIATLIDLHRMKNPYRKTKIIFTIGPATQDEATLERLIHAGVDICRINMAHADHAWSREIIRRVRKVCDRVGRQIAIMMDVKGPEIRTGDVPETFELEQGETFDFTYGEGIGGIGEDGVRRVDVNYPELAKDIKVGDTVLVDSGFIRLKVLSFEGATGTHWRSSSRPNRQSPPHQFAGRTRQLARPDQKGPRRCRCWHRRRH